MGCDVEANDRAGVTATARSGIDVTVDASVPGSFRELRALAAGALIPLQLSPDALIRCMAALRLLLRRCEAEFMRRHGYGRRSAPSWPQPTNTNGPRPDRRGP